MLMFAVSHAATSDALTPYAISAELMRAARSGCSAYGGTVTARNRESDCVNAGVVTWARGSLSTYRYVLPPAPVPVPALMRADSSPARIRWTVAWSPAMAPALFAPSAPRSSTSGPTRHGWRSAYAVAPTRSSYL